MANLLIIELPGGNDTDILQAAVDRGDEFTFLSGDLALYRSQPLVNEMLALARELIEVAPFEYDEVEQRVLAAHAEQPFDALLCLIDTRLIEAVRLAHRLGLRHLNPASAALLRDKFSVRRRLAELGIAQAPFALATSNAEIKAAVSEVGLPALIKPADGYGSQNIVVLRYQEDLDPLLSPLEDLLPIRADYGFGVRSNDRLLVERYMAGAVIGCDTFTEDGCHRLLGINEKLLAEPPSFAIRGGSFIPNQPEFKQIERYVFSLLDAVGFDWGATHVELMLTAEGPRLIEINPRLVGAKIARLVSRALSLPVHQELIALHAGESSTFCGPPSSLVAASRWVFAEKAGTLDRVQLPDWSDRRIQYVQILKQPGDYVRSPLENVDRIGYVMVTSATRDEAEELAERYISDCRGHLRCETNAERLAA